MTVLLINSDAVYAGQCSEELREIPKIWIGMPKSFLNSSWHDNSQFIYNNTLFEQYSQLHRKITLGKIVESESSSYDSTSESFWLMRAAKLIETLALESLLNENIPINCANDLDLLLSKITPSSSMGKKIYSMTPGISILKGEWSIGSRAREQHYYLSAIYQRVSCKDSVSYKDSFPLLNNKITSKLEGLNDIPKQLVILALPTSIISAGQQNACFHQYIAKSLTGKVDKTLLMPKDWVEGDNIIPYLLEKVVPTECEQYMNIAARMFRNEQV